MSRERSKGPPHRTESFFAALSTAGCIVARLLFYRRPRMAIAGVLLCSPMFAFIVGALGNYWFLFSFVFPIRPRGLVLHARESDSR